MSTKMRRFPNLVPEALMHAGEITTELQPQTLKCLLRGWGCGVAQQSRTVAALTEDSGLIPGTYMVAHKHI